MRWRKSSYSDSSGGNCLEAALDWRKSSHSDDSGGDCVEVGRRPDRAPVHIRDSKNPTGPTLILNHSTWASFLGHVKAHIPV
ncbi:toxin [Streptomyces hiroshimensis]|uniref:Toxin n=1 Tax=Streptomyces hiroshimensis TaxID=66424 RepID=A0ABQ2YNF8_9ACTN|nr:toxin [Streptomyces hiroshimensis]